MRPFHGVRHPTAIAFDLTARCRAYATKMPRESFFNSITAAQLMGLPLPLALEQTTTIHVAVEAPAFAPAGRGVRGHKVQLMGDDARMWRGMRVASPTRVWCELAAVLSLHDLVAAGDYLVAWELPLCSIADLRDAVARYPGRRGRRHLESALVLLSDRSESPQESRLRVILALAGITGLVANLRITVRGRRFRADLALPTWKLAIEYQSDYHRDPGQWRKDMTKREILATVGWHTMHVNADDLKDGVELVERILVVISSRRHAD